MRVLSIMTVDEDAFQRPSEEEQQKMGAFIAEMKHQGVLIDTGGAMDGMFEVKVSRRRDGKMTVTDGPFTEAKEFVGGYALLEVEGRDAAVEWTKRFLNVIGNGVTCHLHEVSVA